MKLKLLSILLSVTLLVGNVNVPGNASTGIVPGTSQEQLTDGDQAVEDEGETEGEDSDKEKRQKLSGVQETGTSDDAEVLERTNAPDVQKTPAETQEHEVSGKTELETFHENVTELQKAYALFEASGEEAVFRTGRLLAESSQAFNAHGAVEVLQYREFYVLQYDTMENIKAAYEALQEEGINVVPDVLLGDLEKIKAEPEETVQEEADEFGRFQTELLERAALSDYLAEHLPGNTEGNRKIAAADRTFLDVLGQDAGDGVQVYTSKTGEETSQSLVENYLAMMELEAGGGEAGAVLLSVKSSTVQQGTLFAGKIKESLDAGKVILFPIMDEVGNLTGYEYVKGLPEEEVKEEAEEEAEEEQLAETEQLEEEQEPESKEEEKKEEGQESKAQAGYEAAKVLQEEQDQKDQEKRSETLESRELLKPKTEGTLEKEKDIKAGTVINLKDNETYDSSAKKDGYQLKESRTITCTHNEFDYSAVVSCEGDMRNPSVEYLKERVRLKGKLKGKSYTTGTVEGDIGGEVTAAYPISNKVFYVKIKGAKGLEDVKIVVAEPYVCDHPEEGKKYKGYVYWNQYYSYCLNTKAFYHVGTSHYWLGCSAGDEGYNEEAYREYSHNVTVYKFVPNTLKVKYNANGGSIKSNPSRDISSYKHNWDYETGAKNPINASSFGLYKTGYHFVGWNTKPDGSGKDFDEGTDYEMLEYAPNLKTGNRTVTLYAQWETAVGTIKYHSNGGTIKGNLYENENGKDYRVKSGVVQSSEHGENEWKNVSTKINQKTTQVNLMNVGSSNANLNKTGYHVESGKEWYYFDKNGNKKTISQAKTDVPSAMTALLKDGDDITIDVYANWIPNTLTVNYNANGGTVSGTPNLAVATFSNNWNYETAASDPANFSSFGLTRTGYKRKDGAEWNTKADGSGTSFDQDVDYAMTKYASNLTTGNRTVILYAQWTPNVYTVTLDNQLTAPENAGTKAIYEKYNTGWFLDKEGKKPTAKVVKPEKTGYNFLGYFTEKTGGTMMIKEDGQIVNVSASQITSDTTWYAHYEYLIACEDYADVPCDFKKTDGDTREDVGALLAYDEKSKKVTVRADQAGFNAFLTGKPSGTKVGQFKSVIAGGSASGPSGNTQEAVLSMVPAEGAAYQLKVTAGGKTICDRTVYFKDGRFRTIVKLGEKEEKTRAKGEAIAGSDWGADTAGGAIYDLYKYISCSEIKNVSAPGTVYRYFTYKDVNMAYSGNGATSGTNMLENDVSLENMYQFRENGFTKEKTMEKETADNETYECDVKYSFEGWKMVFNIQYQQNDQDRMADIYQEAKSGNALSDSTTEDIRTYQSADPIAVTGTLFSLNTAGNQKAAQSGFETTLQNFGAGQHATEYINLLAQWNAFPTIVVTPGDSLEFYEGEEVTKDDLISHLTAHDEEDNRKTNRPYIPDLNDKLRIVKVVYPESENGSQEAYEKEYEEDVPEDFLLDTYYLKLEKDEIVDVLVTFAVTDSNGNTTEEEIPVKVKYNNPPEINCEDEYYYFKEEANRGEITAEALIGRAAADDVEDGEEITAKLELVDFDPQELQMQTQYQEVFPVTYRVTDAYKKTTVRTVNVMVWDEEAYIAEQPKYYVRYISEKYLDTLEENSVWREPENMAYLQNILSNETPMETWEFSHEDVLAVQDWITEDGDGHWKIGQEANREFLTKFAYCKQ